MRVHSPCRFRSICLAFVFLGGTLPAGAQDWTRFRGPNGSGVSDAQTVPTQWSEKDYNWKVSLPGIGHSSPVIWGDKIFLISAFDDTATRLVLCLRADDGQIEWQREYPSTPHSKHQLNSFASSTPCVDEERVYVTWTAPEEFTLLALDHQGNEVWRRNLGPFVSQHSGGASPVVYGDLLIMADDQGDEDFKGKSSLIALDRRTGEPRWRVDRRTKVVAYSTPCVYRPRGQAEQLIFTSQAHGITSIDPASGGVNWELEVFDKRSVSSPVIAGGLIFGTCGSGGGGSYVAAVRPPASSGDAPELVYTVKESAPYCPTLVAFDGVLFLWSDSGIVSSVDIASGKPLGRLRVSGNYFGSPVCVGGRLYCLSDDGDVVVVSATKNPKLLARNPLGEESHSTPAVAGDRMYLRTISHLISIGGKP
ncbi:MAG TPA: PQQ-binding-like beta-propeller repeat protein [Pirellulales bacterium]|nr:PQQ-binding-like beta-propeller repeat protein [Pirellulales bacterium]